jgi:hypothetical protein
MQESPETAENSRVDYNPKINLPSMHSAWKRTMIIVLSPAKSLDFKTPPAVDAYTQPDFLDQSKMLIEKLRRLPPAELGALMGISDKLAALNATRYAEWSLPFAPDNAKQAVLAFNGDVYEGLDANTLAAADLDFAQSHLRILSGLYGVLRPLDLMQAYRLEMGTPIKTRRGKDLYSFWGARITTVLNEALLETGASALVNLASDEYFRSVNGKKLAVPVVKPVFEDWSAGKFKVISFHAKRARGLMARYAVTRRLLAPEALQNFDGEGYAFEPAASDTSRWVFRRRSAAAK